MKIEIIPATDIIGGACVRLTQGDYGRRTTYYRDPLEAAQRFEEAGIRRLHMVDLDGAKASERSKYSTAAESKAAGHCAAYSTQAPAAPSAAASPCANRNRSPNGSQNSAAGS